MTLDAWYKAKLLVLDDIIDRGKGAVLEATLHGNQGLCDKLRLYPGEWKWRGAPERKIEYRGFSVGTQHHAISCTDIPGMMLECIGEDPYDFQITYTWDGLPKRAIRKDKGLKRGGTKPTEESPPRPCIPQ